MISASEVVPIGQILKTHGIEGELSFQLNSENSTSKIFLSDFEMDGIWFLFLKNGDLKRKTAGF